ncbi:MAG TPA: hypothetical protein VNH40_05680, partial [Gaiellaceae bacterium]|nr:hypothetical protein [Gaiellaceae bacterium]
MVGCIVVLTTAALVTTASAGARSSARPSAAARVDQLLAGYPRAQTLITSGTQWGNIAGTNPYVGNYAAGMVGLINETLLRFDPVKGTYINWLAQSAKWTGAKQFTIVV